MEKIILVVYVDIGNLDGSEVQQYIENVRSSFNSDDTKNLFLIIIPIEGETRIECLNPKLLSEDDFKEAKEIFEKYKLSLDKFINKKENENN